MFDSKAEARILFEEARAQLDFHNPLKDNKDDEHKDNCEKAIPLLEMAVSLDPENPGIRTLLGHSLAKTGAHDAALHHLRKVLDKFPGESDARLQILEIMIGRRRYVEALPLARAGTELFPRKSVLWHARAFLSLQTGQYEDALSSGKKALETATPEDHALSSQYKSAIVKIILEARQAIREGKPAPLPGHPAP